MQLNFKTIINFIVEGIEKEWSDDPNDPGNWTGGAVNSGELKGTKWGIAASSHPHLDIKNLSREECDEIYFSEYWSACRCDELPPQLAFMVMDTAVNQGQGRATRLLQRALAVKEDGIIGPQTVAAAHKNPSATLTEFAARRMHQYMLDPAGTRFGLGWSRRLMTIFRIAIEST